MAELCCWSLLVVREEAESVRCRLAISFSNGGGVDKSSTIEVCLDLREGDVGDLKGDPGYLFPPDICGVVKGPINR